MKRKLVCICGALLCLVIATGVTGKEKNRQEKGYKAHLLVTPRLQVFRAYQGGAAVEASLIIENATEDTWCPRVEWWLTTPAHPNDGNRISSQESQCVPYEQADPGEIAFRSYPDNHQIIPIGGPGDFLVVAKLYRADRQVDLVDMAVTVQ